MKNLPDFDGKVVSFGLVDSSLAIINPKFEKQAGRIFIVGHIPQEASTNNYGIGKPCAISWDAITDYIVFENEKEYIKQIKKSEKKKK